MTRNCHNIFLKYSSKMEFLFHFTLDFFGLVFFFYISNQYEFDKLFTKDWINKLVHEHTKQFLFK